MACGHLVWECGCLGLVPAATTFQQDNFEVVTHQNKLLCVVVYTLINSFECLRMKGQQKGSQGQSKPKTSSLPPVKPAASPSKGQAKAVVDNKTKEKEKNKGLDKLPVIPSAKPDPDNEVGKDAAPAAAVVDAACAVAPDDAPVETSAQVVAGTNPSSGQAVETAPPTATDAVTSPSEAVPAEPPAPAYKPEEHNGMVKLIYEQYNEDFPIVNGSTTQENIDDVYCLSFVMPNCLIHLSKLTPAEKRQKDIDQDYENMFIEENPKGVYQGLYVNETYYVYVEQEAQQLARDQEMMRQRAKAGASKTQPALPKDDGRVMESCSCIYGNPCVDEYGCKDWNNRFAVATKNGWKGF